MLKWKLMLLSSMISFNVFSTVDGFHSIYIVVDDENYDANMATSFKVQQVPMIGCWGVTHGPEYSQLTAPYEVPIAGCGNNSKININVLTCAEITDWKELSDYSGTAAITLNISKCEKMKDDQDFINAVKKVVALNFKNPQGKPSVKLTLVK